jgi:sn-glycerol 3-phosphate transport system substrate-binding protein
MKDEFAQCWKLIWRGLRGCIICLAWCAGLPAHAKTEIHWWHAMVEANRTAIEQLARDFNASQNEFSIVPTYKGSYDATMAAGLAAFEKGNPPHILQVVEVGTATMMATKGLIKPVHEVMREARQYFDPNSYLPAITGYYSTAKGEMLSFPFNSSSAVMWINQDSLVKAGLSQARLETWPQVFEAARRLQASGHPTCGFSTAWPSWIMIEQFSAWHNLPIASKVNGIDGLDARLAFDTPLHARHLSTLAQLQMTRVFDYSGREDQAEGRFVSGECPIVLSSSGFFGRAQSQAKFAFRSAPMPYYPDVDGAPQNSLIGGASLWVMRGKTPHEYRGVARFFAFLSEIDRQAWLHQRLGYLPVTRVAFERTRAEGFYAQNPFHLVPLESLTRRPPTENSRGVRLGDMVGLRNIWAEELEAVFAGRKAAAAGLSAAVERGDALLHAFEKVAR